MKSDIYLFAFCCLTIGVIIGAQYYLEWWGLACIAANLFTSWQAINRINAAVSRS